MRKYTKCFHILLHVIGFYFTHLSSIMNGEQWYFTCDSFFSHTLTLIYSKWFLFCHVLSSLADWFLILNLSHELLKYLPTGVLSFGLVLLYSILNATAKVIFSQNVRSCHFMLNNFPTHKSTCQSHRSVIQDYILFPPPTLVPISPILFPTHMTPPSPFLPLYLPDCTDDRHHMISLSSSTSNVTTVKSSLPPCLQMQSSPLPLHMLSPFTCHFSLEHLLNNCYIL